MMLIKFGHGRWDLSYDRDYSTDDRVQWVNVSDREIKVQLCIPDVCDDITFPMQPCESYTGYTGTVLSIAE